MSGPYQRSGQAILLPLVIERGATFVFPFRWLDSVGPVNMEGYIGDMQIRTYDLSTVLVNLTTENGRLLLEGVTGWIIMSLNHIITAAIPLADARYDLKLTAPGEQVIRLVYGPVSVSEEVTRSV